MSLVRGAGIHKWDMQNRRVLVGLVVCAIVVAVGGWYVSKLRQLSATPNVLLITIDTLRPDRLSAYGYTKHQTPHFDRLAREGVLFEHAFCDVTWTTPSMTSVMTGHYATVHGVRTGFERLDEGATTLAEVLRAAGMQTAAIIASFPLSSIYGLNQGFDLYDENFSRPLALDSARRDTHIPPKKVTPGTNLFGKSRRPMQFFLLQKEYSDAYRPDNEVSDRAIHWLREERHEPFFLWVHYLGPHTKPAPAGRRLVPRRQQYDADVVFADQQVGRVLAVLDALDLTDHTAVILHADHGESLGEHTYFGHGVYVYDATQHIPLLMRLPGRLPAGRRMSHMARNVDLFPTILDLAGVPLTVPVDGHSLAPIIAGKKTAEPEETYVESYLAAGSLFARRIDHGSKQIGFRRLGVRTPDWKFIVDDPIPLTGRDDPAPVNAAQRLRYFSEELYDLGRDPGEMRNVIRAHQKLAASFRKRVAAYQNLQGSRSKKLHLDARSRDRLRSLGYLE